METNISSAQKEVPELPPPSQQSLTQGFEAQEPLEKIDSIILNKDTACNNLISKQTTVEPGIVSTQPDRVLEPSRTPDHDLLNAIVLDTWSTEAHCSDTLGEGPPYFKDFAGIDLIFRWLRQIDNAKDGRCGRTDPKVLVHRLRVIKEKFDRALLARSLTKIVQKSGRGIPAEEGCVEEESAGGDSLREATIEDGSFEGITLLGSTGEVASTEGSIGEDIVPEVGTGHDSFDDDSFVEGMALNNSSAGARSPNEMNPETRRDMTPGVPRHVKATKIGLRMVLMYTEGMFRHRRTLNDSVWVACLAMGKKVLGKSQAEPETRLFLAESPELWKELEMCFAQAMSEIERQSFISVDAANEASGASNADVMLANQVNLTKDLERLNDLLMIARNMLATTNKAQNLAATSAFDKQVIKYIDLCVRVTARGYDGDNNQRAEAQWTSIIGFYKKVLITCLQFLHNLVMHNETRKLHLWLELFGKSKSSDPFFDVQLTRVSQDPTVPESTDERRSSAGNEATNHIGSPETSVPTNGHGNTNKLEQEEATPFTDSQSDYENAFNKGTALLMHKVEQLRMEVSDTVQDHAQLQMTETDADSNENGIASNQQPSQPRRLGEGDPVGIFGQTESSVNPDEIRDEDMRVLKTPESAAKTLSEAKDQLMARLQEPAPAPLGRNRPPMRHNLSEQAVNEEGQQYSGYAETQLSDIAADGSAEDEDDEDEEGLLGVSDQERGLLTDIPLVLGPQEIEALPMLIQLGIMRIPHDASRTEETTSRLNKMQAVRCNLLLAQDTGRNLLRELLIFIAAWDLQDDEFYFKLMMCILEDILHNGLMPFAYQTFGELKDIVSPAQSIIIKILTQIFRKKQGLPPANGAEAPIGSSLRREAPTRVDLLIVRYIFTVFRQSIIPETCALIYLQGQIRLGVAFPEDFPLTLWDMERVYEGVYQFLEFFAVLTENETWKELLVRWEIVSELVTLLRELDASIPKAPLTATSQPTAQTQPASNGTADPLDTVQDPTSAPLLIERPYDPVPNDAPPPSVYEGDSSRPDSPDPDLTDPHPAEFEWRNLKKLVVLVLSSLVWKSPAVQDQIRQYGGVEMVLSCCNYDANNPYIREHAIMCLRFLLENCPRNQQIVEQLEARKVVPDEVLDKQGYETFIDAEGKVGLRRKDGVVVHADMA
ncbi:copper transport protein [Xylographa soralifera]|nr:copper transport protein [Xylographa soralifera]